MGDKKINTPIKYISENIKLVPYWSQLNTDLERISDLGTQFNDYRLMILVTHLNMEYWMNKLLKCVLKEPKSFLDERPFPTYSTKLKLIKSLKIIENENILLNLKKINDARNLYAHNLDHENFEIEVEKIIQDCFNRYEPAKEHLENLKLRGFLERKNWNDLSQKAFCLCLLTVYDLNQIWSKIISEK